LLLTGYQSPPAHRPSSQPPLKRKRGRPPRNAPPKQEQRHSSIKLISEDEESDSRAASEYGQESDDDESLESEEEEEWFFDCICGKKGENYNDGKEMIECERCKVWQHTKCNKLKDKVLIIVQACQEHSDPDYPLF